MDFTAKPYLLVVTGRPGSGKTTFAKALSDEIFMPVISRDQIKEGYVHTFGKKHAELGDDTNKRVTDIFFDTLRYLTANKISVIAEAAFQHSIWSSMLEPFMEMTRIYLLICRVDGMTALDRFIKRGLENSLREYFHGDIGVGLARKGIEPKANPYEEPRLDAPTFIVDTSEAYVPSVQDLKRMILKEHKMTSRGDKNV